MSCLLIARSTATEFVERNRRRSVTVRCALAVSLACVPVAVGCSPSIDYVEERADYYDLEQQHEQEMNSERMEEFLESECDPNYVGVCVPVVDYDLDCADIDGPVYVVGDDIHGFDRDRDGVGCEPYP